MASFSLKKYVAAPPPQVFAKASDFAQAQHHIRSVSSVSMLTPDPVGPGTRFRQTRSMFGREATEELEVIAFDPPQSYTLAGESHGFRLQSDVTCTPSGSGTEIEMRFSITPLTMAATLMAAAMTPMLGQVAEELSKDLDDLQAAIEGAV